MRHEGALKAFVHRFAGSEVQILKGLARKYEAHHKLRPSSLARTRPKVDDSCREAIASRVEAYFLTVFKSILA